MFVKKNTCITVPLAVLEVFIRKISNETDRNLFMIFRTFYFN